MTTKPTVVRATDFIADVPDPVRRADAEALVALMRRVSGEMPAMWGSSIVGFGAYDYRYDSGRTGTMARISFSPRKAETVLYLIDGFDGHGDLLSRLGKHRTGKSCLYIKRLSDVDSDVLEALVKASWQEMARRYP